MPTLQGVHEDFRRNALLAYSICSFFMPQMMTPKEDMVPLEEVKEYAEKDEEAMMNFLTHMGGEAATEALADVVFDFLDRGLVP